MPPYGCQSDQRVNEPASGELGNMAVVLFAAVLHSRHDLFDLVRGTGHQDIFASSHFAVGVAPVVSVAQSRPGHPSAASVTFIVEILIKVAVISDVLYLGVLLTEVEVASVIVDLRIDTWTE